MYNQAMKLVIQIPCYNEESNIARVIEDIPKKIDGIDEIKIIILDDGSTDKTSEKAGNYNVKVIKSNTKKGLANTFKTGVNIALEENADILVNIDGDNQYSAKDIEKLIKPILKNSCDIVIGTRPIATIKTFSPLKKFLQKFGSYIVKIISKANVEDAASGFRAFSKKALLNINVFNQFTYTIETLIQARNKDLIIKNVDINVNIQKNRQSKLFKNNFDYAILLILSFILYMLAIIGDLFTINRKLLEDIQLELRQKKYKK